MIIFVHSITNVPVLVYSCVKANNSNCLLNRPKQAKADYPALQSQNAA